MPIEPIDIDTFLQFSNEYPVFDVRIPGEFSHAHFPGAFAMPLFSDDQRKIIGTAYKQQSRQAAVKIGLDYFSERMKFLKDEVEELSKSFYEIKGDNSSPLKKNTVLLHCWRGGMRSGAVAWLLNLYGFKIYTLKGVYKSFRKWVITQFENEYQLNILGGYTGSGKTEMLCEMKRRGNFVVNLEDLANHKGSSFGSLGEKAQPGQEMFENLFAIELYKLTKHFNTNGDSYTKIADQVVWVEDESRHIGKVGIPKPFWMQMRNSYLYFLDIPFEERLKYIISVYGKFEKKELTEAILRIQKKLGGLETKNAINFIQQNNFMEGFSILLRHYDKLYEKSLHNRENVASILNKIPCPTVDINNAQKFCK